MRRKLLLVFAYALTVVIGGGLGAVAQVLMDERLPLDEDR